MHLAQGEAKQRLHNAMELIRAAKSCGDHMDPTIELECALDQIQLVIDNMGPEATNGHEQS